MKHLSYIALLLNCKNFRIHRKIPRIQLLKFIPYYSHIPISTLDSEVCNISLDVTKAKQWNALTEFIQGIQGNYILWLFFHIFFKFCEFIEPLTYRWRWFEEKLDVVPYVLKDFLEVAISLHL